MKLIALLLLTSCAPVVTAIPSSLPYVRIDESLSGAVISREAAIVVAAKKADAAAKHAKAMIDAEAKQRSTEHERDEANKLADKHTWWATYGGLLVLVGIVAGIASGFAGGFAVAK